MTQDEAVANLREQVGQLWSDAWDYDVEFCTGVAETCPVNECSVCSVRECPHHEPLHFHHDGCPQCEFDEGEKR